MSFLIVFTIYIKKKNVNILSFIKQSDKKEPPIFLNINLVLGIEKVILNQHFQLSIGYLSQVVTGKLFLKKTSMMLLQKQQKY